MQLDISHKQKEIKRKRPRSQGALQTCNPGNEVEGETVHGCLSPKTKNSSLGFMYIFFKKLKR